MIRYTYAGSREMKMQIGKDRHRNRVMFIHGSIHIRKNRWKRKIGIGAGLCGYMFRYTYADCRETKMQIEKEDGHMSRVMCIHVWIHISRN